MNPYLTTYLAIGCVHLLLVIGAVTLLTEVVPDHPALRDFVESSKKLSPGWLVLCACLIVVAWPYLVWQWWKEAS